MAHISVVIPVYKAEDCMHELCRRLTLSLEKITTDFECILVEDCGKDRSWEIICDIAAEDTRFRGIQFSRNFGQHYGITAGLDYCNGDWVVVMDCDLQDQPEEIIKLYTKAQEGFDIVLGRRKNRQDKTSKRLSSKIFFSLFNYLTDMNYDPSVGNFRIISGKVAANCKNIRENLRFFPGMIEWMGFSTTTIDVDHSKRMSGETSYTFGKLLRLATDTIIAYSDKPLRLSIRLGFSIATLAFICGIGLLFYAAFFDVPIMGWSSLIVSVYFLGGIIIANLGIIGIYLGKTFDETKKRPLYIINTTTFIDE
jgi:dolichol-phosphate mannosyltransferase